MRNKEYGRHALAWVNHLADLGFADADILSLTTVEGTSSTTSLMGKIESKTYQGDLKRQAKIALSLAGPNGANILTNTNLAAANDLAGLRAVFTTFDSSLSASHRSSFAF